MSPSKITTIDSLLEALDHRPVGDADAAKHFDDAIWAQVGATGAIMVTDLSGFTRITKQRGIIHFLSIFRRCQRACIPLIDKFEGALLKQEADDFIAYFPDAPQAVACALEMLTTTRALNKTLAEEDRLYMCIGVEYGTLLRLTDDAFGDTVNVAFKLGEDIASSDELLLGKHAFDRIHNLGFDLAPYKVSELKSAISGNVELAHHSIRLKEEV